MTSTGTAIDAIGISRSEALSRIDGRSRNYRFFRACRTRLIAHVGGNPNPVERLLIERAASLSLLEADMFQHGGSDAEDGRHSALLQRLCRVLGMLGVVGGVNHAGSLHERIGLKGKHRHHQPAEASRIEAAAPPPDPPPRFPPDVEREKRLILGDRFLRGAL